MFVRIETWRACQGCCGDAQASLCWSPAQGGLARGPFPAPHPRPRGLDGRAGLGSCLVFQEEASIYNLFSVCVCAHALGVFFFFLILPLLCPPAEEGRCCTSDSGRPGTPGGAGELGNRVGCSGKAGVAGEVDRAAGGCGGKEEVVCCQALPCPLEEAGNPPSDKRDRQITVGRWAGPRWGRGGGV